MFKPISSPMCWIFLRLTIIFLVSHTWRSCGWTPRTPWSSWLIRWFSSSVFMKLEFGPGLSGSFSWINARSSRDNCTCRIRWTRSNTIRFESATWSCLSVISCGITCRKLGWRRYRSWWWISTTSSLPVIIPFTMPIVASMVTGWCMPGWKVNAV